MSEWRRSKMVGKRDESEPEVVGAFLDAGATVVKHSGVDEADLVIGYRGRNHLVEVKTNNARLKPGQDAWAKSWKGGTVLVIRNAAQARKAIRCWDLEDEPAALPDLAYGKG